MTTLGFPKPERHWIGFVKFKTGFDRSRRVDLNVISMKPYGGLIVWPTKNVKLPAVSVDCRV